MTTDAAIHLLAKGFAERLVDYVEGDTRLHDVMHELVQDFIDAELPIVRHDDQVEMAIALLNQVRITTI